MAPLPVESTARYFVDYRAQTREHTVMFRYLDTPGGSPPDAAFIADISAFLSALRPGMPTDWLILGARYAVTGSNVTNPVTAPTLTGAGAQAVQQGETPAYMGFLGRSVDGRRCRLFILGAGVSPASEGSFYGDYRVFGSEVTWIDTAIDELDASGVVSISGTEVIWKPYANLGYNAYWQKKTRG